MRQLALNHTSCLVEVGDIDGRTLFSDEEIDWCRVDRRIRSVIWEMGVDFNDVLKFLGIDGEGDSVAAQKELPKMQTAIEVSTYLGIPALWVLTGKGPKPQTRKQPGTTLGRNGFRDTSDSTVVQGTNSGTMIINNMSTPMSEQKKELIRIFDAISIKHQTKLLHFAYALEDEASKTS